MKKAIGADTSNLAAKSDLASLKHEVDRIGTDKLKTVPVDLSKLSNKTVYDKLVTKANAIDFKVPSTSRLVSKTQYNSDKQGLENNFEDVNKKIPSTSVLVEKTNLNSKVIEIENKIPTITGLVTTAAFNTKVTDSENKIPDITNLANKAALNTNTADIENRNT